MDVYEIEEQALAQIRAQLAHIGLEAERYRPTEESAPRLCVAADHDGRPIGGLDGPGLHDALWVTIRRDDRPGPEPRGWRVSVGTYRPTPKFATLGGRGLAIADYRDDPLPTALVRRVVATAMPLAGELAVATATRRAEIDRRRVAREVFAAELEPFGRLSAPRDDDDTRPRTFVPGPRAWLYESGLHGCGLTIDYDGRLAVELRAIPATPAGLALGAAIARAWVDYELAVDAAKANAALAFAESEHMAGR